MDHKHTTSDSINRRPTTSSSFGYNQYDLDTVSNIEVTDISTDDEEITITGKCVETNTLKVVNTDQKVTATNIHVGNILT